MIKIPVEVSQSIFIICSYADKIFFYDFPFYQVLSLSHSLMACHPAILFAVILSVFYVAEISVIPVCISTNRRVFRKYYSPIFISFALFVELYLQFLIYCLYIRCFSFCTWFLQSSVYVTSSLLQSFYLKPKYQLRNAGDKCLCFKCFHFTERLSAQSYSYVHTFSNFLEMIA